MIGVSKRRGTKVHSGLVRSINVTKRIFLPSTMWYNTVNLSLKNNFIWRPQKLHQHSSSGMWINEVVKKCFRQYTLGTKYGQCVLFLTAFGEICKVSYQEWFFFEILCDSEYVKSLMILFEFTFYSYGKRFILYKEFATKAF